MHHLFSFITHLSYYQEREISFCMWIYTHSQKNPEWPNYVSFGSCRRLSVLPYTPVDHPRQTPDKMYIPKRSIDRRRDYDFTIAWSPISNTVISSPTLNALSLETGTICMPKQPTFGPAPSSTARKLRSVRSGSEGCFSPVTWSTLGSLQRVVRQETSYS